STAHCLDLVTIAQDRNTQAGLVGSFVIHAIAFMIILWGFSTEAGLRLLEPPQAAVKEEPVEEVTMIFPEQIIPAIPPPKPPEKAYIRTTQNLAESQAPKQAAFQSDRNTQAASKLPPKSGATLLMPTMEGTAPTKMELANRDYKDGEVKNDATLPTTAAATAAATAMRPPQPQAPPAPPSILKPVDAPPPAPPPQPQVAKVTANDSTPLVKMMEEMDKDAARMDMNRLPLEVRKPEVKPVTETPPAKPQIRAPADMPPPQIAKAIPVSEEEIKMTAGQAEKDSYVPFTRTNKVDGAISREGDNAVDSEATPLGRYMKEVTGAVGKKWHLYVKLARDSVNFGRVRFRFFVDRKGVPQDLQILSDARDADPRMRELTLRAILDAQIPPIPADLLPDLDDERVKIEYEAIVY
ncbi:MAG: hypothetical protein NTV80_10520, partial [Verrucomicrobia bacterium]|nr:hypothetical protein [Verrucomicrobiota bacterium]